MNIFSKLIRLFSSFTRPQPSRDWFLLVSVSCVCFVGFSAYAVYLYTDINSGAAFSTGPEAPTPNVSVSSLDVNSLLDSYRARSANYAAHALPAPAVTDPAKTNSKSATTTL